MDFDGVRSSLSYDATGRLVQGTNGIAMQTSGYNALGQRMSRQVVGGPDSGVRLYAYDEEGRPLGVYIPDSSEPNGFRVLEEYVHLDGWRPVATVRPDPVHGMSVPRIYFILTDHLGTPRKILDGEREKSGEIRTRKIHSSSKQAPNEIPTSGLAPLPLNCNPPASAMIRSAVLTYPYGQFQEPHPSSRPFARSADAGNGRGARPHYPSSR